MILPPRHGKTTLGNVIAPAFALGRNPIETVITVSYGSELSKTFGRRVRNMLSDPAFAEVFPNCKLSPDSAAAYRFTTSTGKGASLLILDHRQRFGNGNRLGHLTGLHLNVDANFTAGLEQHVLTLEHLEALRLAPDRVGGRRQVRGVVCSGGIRD